MTRKEIACEFLFLTSKGEAKKAFQLYVDDEFIHHNAYFKGDRKSLITAMQENARTYPDKLFEIQRALQDRNLVAVHSRVVLTSNGPEMALMHIFKFKNKQIIELWDFGQPAPLVMVNEYGMF